MIIRFSIFISLLALFYYYCKDDSSNHLRQPNDLNLIEVPSEFSPELFNNEYAENEEPIDTLNIRVDASEAPLLISSISQKY